MDMCLRHFDGHLCRLEKGHDKDAPEAFHECMQCGFRWSFKTPQDQKDFEEGVAL
jgi:hypothetical protein